MEARDSARKLRPIFWLQPWPQDQGQNLGLQAETKAKITYCILLLIFNAYITVSVPAKKRVILLATQHRIDTQMI